MKIILVFITLILFLFSCSKNEAYQGSGINSDRFSIYPSNFKINSDGEIQHLKIEIAGGKLWVLHNIPSWCHINITSSRYDEELTLKVDKNESFFQRIAFIKRSVSTNTANSGIVPGIRVEQSGQILNKEITEPGTLTKFIQDAYANANLETDTLGRTINHIILSGNINYEDIHNLRKVNVSELNISQAHIVKSNRESEEGQIESPANVLDNEICSNFTSLSSIKLPEVTEIRENAFYGCNLLKNLEIPESVSYLGAKAFYNCYGLESIQLHQNIQSIGENAFYEVACPIIIEAKIPPTIIITSEKESFNKKDDITLYVPKGTLSSYQNAEGWKEFKNIVESE